MEEGGIRVKNTGNMFSRKIFLEHFAVNKTSANLVRLHLFRQLLLGLDHLFTYLNIIRN
jgi:hypothetical protein